MKKLLLLVYMCAALLTTTILTHTGCKKPTDNPPTGNNTPTPTPCDTCLPPITTHGAGTFGCKINGKPFIAKGNKMNPPTQLDVLHNRVNITGHNYIINQSVSFNIDPLVDTGNIYFPNNAFRTWGQYFTVNKQYSIYDINNGNIKFLRVDYQRRIFSGTFEFDVYDIYNIANGDTIHITEGRFDVPH